MNGLDLPINSINAITRDNIKYYNSTTNSTQNLDLSKDGINGHRKQTSTNDLLLKLYDSIFHSEEKTASDKLCQSYENNIGNYTIIEQLLYSSFYQT
ncbi:MAG: hypothetical protein AB8U25_04220 [Rickettsiales endosymbiont of Dermacentor nuttalli]